MQINSTIRRPDSYIGEIVAAIFIGERGDGKGLQYECVWTLVPDAILTLMTLRRPFFSVVVKWSRETRRALSNRHGTCFAEKQKI